MARIVGVLIATCLDYRATYAIQCRNIHPISEPPPGNAITGFIGVQSVSNINRVTNQRVNLADKDRGVHVSYTISKDELRYDDEFSESIGGPNSYKTYAHLKGLRRIQASTGIEGRSRSPKRLSGLKFDYYGAPSAIVRQWMDDDDVFELSADENIQSITVWLTTIQIARLASHWPLATRSSPSRTVRGDLCARTVMFQSSEVDSFSSNDMQIQYQRGPNQDLASTLAYSTGISWVLNSSYGRVRAVILEKTARTLSVIPGHFLPFDQAQKIYFQRKAEVGHRTRSSLPMATSTTTRFLVLYSAMASGTMGRAGDIDMVADAHQTLESPPVSQVVGMFVGIRRHHIQSLKCKTLEFAVKPSDEQDVPFGKTCILFKDKASAADYTPISHTELVYGPPKEVRSGYTSPRVMQ
ncbi:hypothetical protein RJZ90_006013 [Blastomyces dermatitidis]